MKIVQTADGSATLYQETVGEHYHSIHGALQESKHVFLNSGLQYYLENNNGPVAILEVGFGTGLNYLTTADYAETNGVTIHYTGIERYPLDVGTLEKIGYRQYVPGELGDRFLSQYPQALKGISYHEDSSWQIAVGDVMEFRSSDKFDVLYFDAFAAIHQPEMWSDETLAHVTSFLNPGGVFVTYAITGNLKRSMKALGFRIQKIPGAPGKREMLRAIKA
jgi:tRNA U34 5-methylaminomethyl-2-thiouridine-forming methyltransferase MnmC